MVIRLAENAVDQVQCRICAGTGQCVVCPHWLD